MVNSHGFYEHKFRVHSKSLSIKYQSLVTHIYDHLDFEKLKQLRLTVEETKATELEFFKNMFKMWEIMLSRKGYCSMWFL